MHHGEGSCTKTAGTVSREWGIRSGGAKDPIRKETEGRPEERQWNGNGERSSRGLTEIQSLDQAPDWGICVKTRCIHLPGHWFWFAVGLGSFPWHWDWGVTQVKNEPAVTPRWGSNIELNCPSTDSVSRRRVGVVKPWFIIGLPFLLAVPSTSPCSLPFKKNILWLLASLPVQLTSDYSCH